MIQCQNVELQNQWYTVCAPTFPAFRGERSVGDLLGQ